MLIIGSIIVVFILLNFWLIVTAIIAFIVGRYPINNNKEQNGKSKLGKWIKRCGKFIKREGAVRPLWKVVFGFILLWAIAVKAGVYKYGVQKLLFGTIQNIWLLLLSVTIGGLIKGASDNGKVK